jgi:hypothetical protein
MPFPQENFYQQRMIDTNLFTDMPERKKRALRFPLLIEIAKVFPIIVIGIDFIHNKAQPKGFGNKGKYIVKRRKKVIK